MVKRWKTRTWNKNKGSLPVPFENAQLKLKAILA
ncbi:hypothetical protein SLEP1_g14021 [Rubroshorea leprosula]|uniref:Transposase n=1 Tax=Rubroshorea leprosula TaxID=152421 RepID=A0AAV5IS68_9ROSI|nr:hypothetical protein SLEP1_g14021 [Rubroshorea leprosula]